MNCPECGHPDSHDVVESLQMKVAQHAFDVRINARACTECDEWYFSCEELERAELLVATWLAEHGARDREVFRFMRKALGVHRTDLSKLLDVSHERITRWECGALPVESWACALLGTLVCERAEGSERALQRLRALRKPPTVPGAPISLPSPDKSTA